MEITPAEKELLQREREWVNAALYHGDQKAYAMLLESNYDSVHGMLYRMTNNDDLAHDLTIESFAKAFRKLQTFKAEYTFSRWLRRLATNHCIDSLRKQRPATVSLNQPKYDEDGNYIESQLPDTTPDPEECYIIKQKAILLKDVVNSLKPHYSTIIILRYFDGLSNEDISRRLNLPIGTVKARLFRARELLFQILKNSKEGI